MQNLLDKELSLVAGGKCERWCSINDQNNKVILGITAARDLDDENDKVIEAFFLLREKTGLNSSNSEVSLGNKNDNSYTLKCVTRCFVEDQYL